jgi:hypothetical protein
MAESRHKFVGKVPDTLLERIRNRKCVIFVGSGLSAQARTEEGSPLPTWAEMLCQMIEWCTSCGVQLRAESAELKEAINKGRLLLVAQELKDSLEGELTSCLSHILHIGKVKPSEAHHLICRLPWAAALTSNYDGLFEEAYTMKFSIPPVLSLADIPKAQQYLQAECFFVLKIHGDIKKADSIVLGSRDYGELLYRREDYKKFLEGLFGYRTVLFVGFGGKDPDLDAVINQYWTIYERAVGEHFMLIPEDQFYVFEQRRLREDSGLHCITYQVDSAHSQFTEFFRALAQLTES